MKYPTYFDCDMHVGKIGYKHPLQKWESEDLIKEMERVGIAGALVYHGLAKVYSPLYGNNLLLEELKNSNRLFGCWVLLPSGTGDFPDVDEVIIPQMKENNIVAAKIFPKTHFYIPDEMTIGPLLTALEKANIPLLIERDEIKLGELKDILELHSGLNVIYQGGFWGDERYIFPIMDKYKNIHIDFSCLQSNEILEVAYERYGAERLIFGSGMPAKSVGAARTFIDYARIPLEAKLLVAGGNFIRLTGAVLPSVNPPNEDFLMEEASKGKPISIPVFDSHTHVIEDERECGTGRFMPRSDIHHMIKAYDVLGIDKMCIASWLAIFGDAERGNEITEAAMKKFPERVLGYASLNPCYTRDMKNEAIKWHLDKGFKGLKPFANSSHSRYIKDGYKEWWKLGNEYHLFALADPGGYVHGEYLEDIDALAAIYPNISIFMDHAGSTFDIAVDYAEIAKKHENVYLQLTYTTVPFGMVEYLTSEVGAHKVQFGTDSPMRDPRQQLGWVIYADISVEDKKKILGENMFKIVARCKNN